MRRRFTPGITAGEAAEWLARLRADDRTPEDEAAFRVWLDADPGNAAAFEAVNAIWESVGALSRELRIDGIRPEPPKRRKKEPSKLSK